MGQKVVSCPNWKEISTLTFGTPTRKGGPKYYHLMKFTFHYACPIALNTTAVLFIGLFYVDTEATDFQYPKPKHTMIYNFETKTWTKQDSLDFSNEKFLIGYDQNMACTTEQKKDHNR